MNLKLVNFILIGVLFITIWGCNPDDKNKTTKTVLKDLLKNKEIKESDLHIRNLTNNEQGITIVKEGEKGNDRFVYYKLGFSSEEKFETYFVIRLNMQSGEYEMEDLADGTWKKLNH